MTTRYDPHALTLARRLQDQVAPAQVVLFGSRARGDWHAASDIDLMVIADDPTPERRREFIHLGMQLERETPRLYPERIDIQVLSMSRAKFDWARRSRMHLAGGVQHDGLTAQGEPMPPIRQDDPWPAVQEFLRVSYKALARALRHESEGEHQEAALQAHHALETALKAYVSALGLTFRKSHDLQMLMDRIRTVEQVVDFSGTDAAWCEAMLKLRRFGPYYDKVELFRPSADIVDTVQQISGTVAGRALALTGRRPDEVGYALAKELQNIRGDRPLCGLEDAHPEDFDRERLRARDRQESLEQGRREGMEQGRQELREQWRDSLMEAAYLLYETSDQLDDLRRHLNRHPPEAWPSLADLMAGKWPADPADKDDAD